ncbi:unnamed protein product [Calicophoron daubneyi]|uniref:Uncharacterized protein n=1 Tax=Calicophoron daubneyi TaxID=300641 RepID=A0AAV2TGQ0_CALDB
MMTSLPKNPFALRDILSMSSTGSNGDAYPHCTNALSRGGYTSLPSRWPINFSSNQNTLSTQGANGGCYSAFPSAVTNKLHATEDNMQKIDRIVSQLNRSAANKLKLRRSNTVGANDLSTSSKIADHFLNRQLPSTDRFGSSRSQVSSRTAEHSIQQEIIRQLIGQNTRASSDELITHSRTGPSPTERVMRRLGTIASTSMDKKSAEQNPPRTSYGSERIKLSKEMLTKVSIELEKDGGAEGSSPVHPFHSSIAGRGRLRRGHTIDGASALSIKTTSDIMKQSPRVTFKGDMESFDQHSSVAIDPSGRLWTDVSHQPADRLTDSQVPSDLQFSSERFQGRVLVQWLCRELVRAGDAWSYNLINVVIHLCFCFLRLGVLQPDKSTNQAGQQYELRWRGPRSKSLPAYEGEEEVVHDNSLPGFDQRVYPGNFASGWGSKLEQKFELNKFYRWTGQSVTQLLNLLQTTQSAQEPANSMRSNQDFHAFQSRLQAEFADLRRDYEYELDRLTRDHELQLFRVKNEGVMKVCQLTNRIEVLEQQVEKYRVLAGIEHLTQSSLVDDSGSRQPEERQKGTTSSLRGNGSSEEMDEIPKRSVKTKGVRVGFSLPDTIMPQRPPRFGHNSNVVNKRRVSDGTDTIESNFSGAASPPPSPPMNGDWASRKEDRRGLRGIAKFNDNSTTDSGIGDYTQSEQMRRCGPQERSISSSNASGPQDDRTTENEHLTTNSTSSSFDFDDRLGRREAHTNSFRSKYDSLSGHSNVPSFRPHSNDSLDLRNAQDSIRTTHVKFRDRESTEQQLSGFEKRLDRPSTTYHSSSSYARNALIQKALQSTDRLNTGNYSRKSGQQLNSSSILGSGFDHRGVRHRSVSPESDIRSLLSRE